MSAQEQVQKRAWVKNAAIAFLALMLVLTLFSNTIMNYSLPEVAVRYAESGSINAKIRGTGTVTANQSYEVSIPETRKVASVAVQLGDVVNTGDLLFTLEESESSELEAAQAELDSMLLSYRLALLEASGDDYTRDNHEIEQLQSKLLASQAECTLYYVSDAEISFAESRVAELEAEIRQLNVEISDLGGSGSGNLSELKKQRKEAEAKLSAAELAYRDEMAAIRLAAEEAREADLANGITTNDPLEVYMAALAITYMNGPADACVGESELLQTDVANAYNEVTRLEAELATLQATIKNDTSDEYADLTEELRELELELDEAKLSLADLNEKQGKWQSAKDSAESFQAQLDEKLFNLEEQKKLDNKEQQKNSLNFTDQQKKIAEQQAKVDELRTDSVSASVTAAAPGVITAIHVTAGNETIHGEAMAVIEAQDLGYSLSFPVSLEQAKKV
ncbi:MAG: biotin/lipoyl-binding protein, partial [Bacillota bacterium]|nr:biotin/lipoyl-binding protein [Bacillota bacterium]